ncbi:unnamed protein product [marine sediment metagenome]|uniref:site-specific DNA-methyltransferase (cytosine-N(4)-specific) n=1 Tax=marine sediment metagenome TaxID=412755 RepID=X1FQ71_9ZZZZ
MPLKLDVIYNEDCIGEKGMRILPNNSIDLTVTSPPYDNLRTYGGYKFDFEPIAQELYRVTKNGGVVVWVVGDATINGSETGTSFKQALYFKKIGFNLHDTMIFKKLCPLPSANFLRYRQEFEYMFVLTKDKPKVFNAIQEKCKQVGRIPYSKYRYPNGLTKLQNTLEPTKENKIKGNVWTYDVGYMKSTKDKIAFKHPATFPEQLAEDHILSWSNENDIVLDPMFGSGTILKMAKKNNRHYIGYEINSKYCPIAKARLLAEKTLWD